MATGGPVPEVEQERPRPGRPVPAELRTRAESVLGVGLDAVRLHDDAAAVALARRHTARAFTVGTDVVFHSGHLRPDTVSGRLLIAHELAHVGQQARGGPATSPAHEAAADSAAAVIVGDRAGPAPVPGAALGVQREPLVRDGRAGLNARPLDLVDVIKNEVADIEEVTVRLAAQVPVSPEKHARNAVRLHAERVAAERDALVEIRGWGGEVGAVATAALPRIERCAKQIAQTVAIADQWHRDHPAGTSLGQDNEAVGTWLAGKALRNWERGGVGGYFKGGLAYAGTAVVATLDAAETMLSFGFHEAATQVAEAYARGDISWQTGEDILWKAAWRSLLIAAISATAGYGAGRLVGAGARAAGLGAGLTRVGVATGMVEGGVSAATGLATTAAVTEWWRDSFTSPEARRIFGAAMPSGKDWAIAIPLGMVLGAAGGAKAARDLRGSLIGKVVDTPVGKARVAHVSPDGKVVVLEDIARARPAPPPPPGEITMVLDPGTGVWHVPGAPPAGATSGAVRPTATNAPVRTGAPPPARPARLPAPRFRPALLPPRPAAEPPTSPALVPEPQGQVPVVEPPASSAPAQVVEQPAASLPAPVVEPPVRPVPPPVAEPPAPAVPAPVGGPPVRPVPAPVTEPLAPSVPATVAEPPAPQPPVAEQGLKPSVPEPAPPKGPQAVAPTRPLTATARDAAKRVTETQDVLRRAVSKTAAAKSELDAAQANFETARRWRAETPKDPVAVELHRDAATALAKARADLTIAQHSETWAAREAADVARARAAIDNLEQELARLGREVDIELNPKGGFTREQVQEGRSRWMTPRANQPSAARYFELERAAGKARLQLADEVRGLRTALRNRVEVAPGPEARGPAMQNAATLDEALHPIAGRPIDVATGAPMTTDLWATDHLVSRSRIAADPRFVRLTPMQQEHMLHSITENFLPMLTEVNSSKGSLTVAEWLARRRDAGKPLPPAMESALLAAEERALTAIDQAFTRLLSE